MTSTGMRGDCVGECKHQITLLRGSKPQTTRLHSKVTQSTNVHLLYNPRTPSAPLLTLPVNKHLKFICHIHVICSAFPELPDGYITGTQRGPNV